jgi:hypothetical protein
LNQIRARLTYANVMSSIAVFLVLAGGAAVAATQLPKNSVGTKQLKKNAVTAAKLKKNAVTTAKIKKGAVKQAKLAGGSVGGAQIINGAVTGEKIEAASTPFSRVVGTLSRSDAQVWTTTPYAIGTYTQPVGEQDEYVVSLDVTFAASCVSPRIAYAYVTVNAANPASPAPPDLAGLIYVEDKGSGAVTIRGNAGVFPGGYGPLSAAAPLAPTNRTFSVLPAGSSCSSGSGITLAGAKVEVIGTKAG